MMSPGTNFIVNGTLSALGTPTAPIIISSLQEGTTAAAPGQWGSLNMGTGSSGSRFDHTIVRYGGAPSGGGADIFIVGSTGVFFTNGEASFSSGSGLIAQGGIVNGSPTNFAQLSGSLFKGNAQWGAVLDGQTASISGNTIDGNAAGGIKFQGFSGAPSLSSNTFLNNGAVMQLASPNIYPNDQGGNILGPNNQMAGIDILGSTNGVIWNQPGTWNFTTIPYVLRSGLVQFLAPLTIGPGVVVKALSVGPGNSRTVFAPSAPLTVQGTLASPVVFTSLRDSSVGGNTDLFEGSLSPALGDWGSIDMGTGSSGSRFDHTIVRYGGAPSGGGADLFIVGSTGVFFTNGEASFSSGSGIIAQGGIVNGQPTFFTQLSGSLFKGNAQWGAVLDGQTASISGNTFDGNTAGGIKFQGFSGAPALSSNTFQNNGVVMQIASPNIYLNDQGGNVPGPSNQMAGIDILGSTNGVIWNQPGTWNFTTIPYVLRSGLVQFLAPLTIGPGVVVKALAVSPGNPNTVLAPSAPLTVQGTSIAPVVFTSLRDVTAGGNTDLFEGNPAPAPGDWGSLDFGNGATGSRLNFAVIRYGGNPRGGGADVYVNSSSVTIANSNIGFSSQNGVTFDFSSAGLIVGTTIQLNALSGVLANTAQQVQVSTCIIHGNSFSGISNSNLSETVNAQFDYWGSTTGPTSPANPGGTGDAVTSGVNFIPFLTAPPGIGNPPSSAPPSPVSLTASPGDTFVDLSWSQSTGTAAGYQIYRDGSTAPLNAAPLPANQLSYRDIALTDGRTYTYTITAVDNFGAQSIPSAPVAATPVAGLGWQ